MTGPKTANDRALFQGLEESDSQASSSATVPATGDDSFKRPVKNEPSKDWSSVNDETHKGEVIPRCRDHLFEPCSEDPLGRQPEGHYCKRSNSAGDVRWTHKWNKRDVLIFVCGYWRLLDCPDDKYKAGATIFYSPGRPDKRIDLPIDISFLTKVVPGPEDIADPSCEMWEGQVSAYADLAVLVLVLQQRPFPSLTEGFDFDRVKISYSSIEVHDILSSRFFKRIPAEPFHGPVLRNDPLTKIEKSLNDFDDMGIHVCLYLTFRLLADNLGNKALELAMQGEFTDAFEEATEEKEAAYEYDKNLWRKEMALVQEWQNKH